MFTNDLDGMAPYLNPTKPVSREHIKQVAGKAHVMPDEVEDKILSLSAYLGWNIEKGSE